MAILTIETLAQPHSVVRPKPNVIWYSEHRLPICKEALDCFAWEVPFRGVWQGTQLCRLQLPKQQEGSVAESEPIGDGNAPFVWAEGWSWLQQGLEDFFAGMEQPFPWQSLYLERRTSFQQKVLHACRQIPRGETRSYQELAEKVGSPKAARAVGQVMASNCFPLFIPCHRVVATGSKLGGFSAPGGVDTKRQLLAWEAGRNWPSKAS